ncbi:hypothetical protein [Thermus hydrothermalis]|uniref:hypothetical protein n=1 Tax=Thermus hydrothermalis TaxID=2908148 RepID=UPI001FA9CAE3|nr:hypothetical protein [Thermus hydrothermalis]
MRPVITGFADVGGFLLTIYPEPQAAQAERLEVRLKGFRLTEKRDPLAPLDARLSSVPYLGHLLSPAILPLALILLFGALQTWRVEAPQLALFFLASSALLGVVYRVTGQARWHTLEHQSVQLLQELLEAGKPLQGEALEAALRAKDPFHPYCGSLIPARLFGPMAFFALFLPIGPSALLSLLLYPLLAEGKGNLFERLYQGLFLARPREREVKATVRALEAYLAQKLNDTV